jgi:lysyl-tRNA synthetase, class II
MMRMMVAVQAIGHGLLGDARASVAAFTLGLVATFIAVRIHTRLIRARVTWWFGNIGSEDRLHVHHMVIGVLLMISVGFVLIAETPAGLSLQLCAFAFGAGVALTLDEFALILHLQDVYWTAEGRRSVDAVVVAVCVGFLIILGFDPLRGNGYTANVTGVLGEATIAVNMCFAVVCLLKGKYWTGSIGIFVPLLAFVGAVRVARPGSPWARWRYAKNPKKMAKVQRREDRIDATWRSWRETFFDLIAGKPHLPSVLQVGAHRAQPPDAGRAPAAEEKPAAGGKPAPPA